MGVRKNQNKLTSAEKARFVAAVKKMKADTAAAYNYNKYVTVHDAAFTGDPNTNPAHLGPAFFPWHRYFLRKFERDLEAADRALGGDGGVTLPYWDWTHDNGDDPGSQRGWLWRDDLLGGFGNPVTTGPFRAGVWPLVGVPGGLVRALGRSAVFSAASTSLPTKTQVDAALDLEGFDCPPFDASSVPGPALAAPPAPVLTGTAGGSLPAGTYRVATTYVNARGETRPSTESVICLGGGCAPANTNTAIRVASPPARPSGTGFNVYVTAANGASLSGTRFGGVTAIGTAVTIGTVAAGAARPSVNSTGSFRNELEGWTDPTGPKLHNRVHTWVGGSMFVGTSPNDPVFFLHHCNIDRLWALWQFRHPGQNYPITVPNTGGVPGNRPHGLNDPMPPWTAPPEVVRAIDVLNHTGMGYTYDTDPPGVAVNVGP
jgi:hypothetical protein